MPSSQPQEPSNRSTAQATPTQREVVLQIKTFKADLRRRFDPEKLVRLYKLIDQLQVPT